MTSTNLPKPVMEVLLKNKHFYTAPPLRSGERKPVVTTVFQALLAVCSARSKPCFRKRKLASSLRSSPPLATLGGLARPFRGKAKPQRKTASGRPSGGARHVARGGVKHPTPATEHVRSWAGIKGKGCARPDGPPLTPAQLLPGSGF